VSIIEVLAELVIVMSFYDSEKYPLATNIDYVVNRMTSVFFSLMTTQKRTVQLLGYAALLNRGKSKGG